MSKSTNKFLLLFGPYRPPRVRVGRKCFCEVYGSVVVSGFNNTDFPWPKAKQDGKGRPPLILCGDLVRAVRRESELAVARHWHVSINSVRKWRRALGVPRVNDGSLKLMQRIEAARDDDRSERARKKSKSPESLAKSSAKLKGRIIPPQTIEAVRKAAQRPRSESWKKKMSAYWRKRGHPPGHPESEFWTSGMKKKGHH